TTGVLTAAVCDTLTSTTLYRSLDGTAVDPCRWEIIDYDPTLAEVSDGAYHVTTTDADFYGTNNSPVPNILQSKVLTGDQWTVETKFTAEPASTYQPGGLRVRADADNYVPLAPS